MKLKGRNVVQFKRVRNRIWLVKSLLKLGVQLTREEEGITVLGNVAPMVRIGELNELARIIQCGEKEGQMFRFMGKHIRQK